MQPKESPMKHLTVPVSEDFDETIRKRMAEGGFGSMAEYLRHTVRQDLERADQAKLERLLLEGLDSGTPIEGTTEWIAERKAQLRKIAKGQTANERSG